MLSRLAPAPGAPPGAHIKFLASRAWLPAILPQHTSPHTLLPQSSKNPFGCITEGCPGLVRFAVLAGGSAPRYEVYVMPKLLEERYLQAQVRKKEEREAAWAAGTGAKKVRAGNAGGPPLRNPQGS